MSSIDKRIVQMQFDNQNFESGVKTTMNSLQALNEKLKMKGATDGLSNVDSGIKKLSSGGLNGLSAGVDGVTSKFSALQVIAVTALANITNSAVNAGKNLLKSFTLDPIMQGFSEYELKMNSIQTILANTSSKGTSLEDVNKALNELNEYSDQTIYNFAQMTDNIGKATAAGLGLEESVIFVKGMANAAAGFGVDANRMAGATYQMTQALASGVIKLQDWNSLTQAGMGGERMQEEMYKAAEGMGIFVDRSIPFRESLASGWLTAEVFMKAMENMANDPSLTKAATEVTTFTKLLDTLKETVASGWAQSMEHIFGDKEQSTKLWTDLSNTISDVINKMSEARNKVLEFWSANGGREAVIKGLGNIFGSLGKIIGSVGKAFSEIFPPMTGQKLVEISEGFKNLTEKFKISNDAAKKIKETFKGIFSVFKTLGEAVGAVIKGFSPLINTLPVIGSGILTVTSTIGKFITKISEAVSKTNIFSNIGNGIKTVFETMGEVISRAGDKVSDFINKLDFSNITSALSTVLSAVGSIIGTIASGISDAIGTINFDTLINMLKALMGVGIFKVLKNVFSEISSIGEGLSGVFESFKGIGENVKSVLDSTKDSLTAWQNSLNANSLLKLAGAIGILAASLTVLASINPGNLATALAGMGGLFAELTLTMAAINKIGNIKGLVKTSTSMILIASAIVILSGALKSLSSLNLGEVATGLIAMAGLLGTMTAAVKLFSTASKGLIKTSTGLIIFGAAMKVMASALQDLGSIDAETLGAGLFALAGTLVELAAFLAMAKFGSLGPSSATGILILSASLIVLAQAFKQFGSFNPEEIKKALAGIGGVLAEIAVFGKLAGSGLNMIGLGTGLTALSAGMLVMAKAVASMGSLQWDEIARGLTSMAGALTILGVASKLISGPQMMLVGAGVTVMSASLLLLGTALKSMGSMSWEEIAKGLVTLAGALTILGVAAAAMSGALVGAAAMVVMAGALAILTPQLILLGTMSLGEIGAALLILAGAFTVIGVAALVLTPIVPVIAALGAAVALLGVGCLAAGAGVAAFATGFAAIGAACAASGSAILDFLREAIKLLPEMGKAAVEAFANFVAGMASAVPQITTGMVAILTAMLSAITTMIPEIAAAGVKIVVEFAKSLASGIPELVNIGIDFVTNLLQGIASRIGDLVNAAVDLVVNFIDTVASNLPRVIQSGINLVLSFVEGVANGLSSNTARLEAAMRNIITAMINAGIAAIKGAISGFVSGGKSLMDGFVKGIKGMASSCVSGVKSCVDSAKKGASNLGSALLSAGKDLIKGFINGIKSMAQSVWNAAKSVVTGAINAAKSALKINSPSKVFIEIGKFTSEGFAVGMEKYGYQAAEVAGDVANAVIDNVRDPLKNVAKIMDGDLNIDPVITPVMDLSNIKAGTRALNGMLPDGTMQMNGVSARLASTVGAIQNGSGNADIVAALKDLQSSVANSGGNTYTINGITYDDGSNVANAIGTLVRAAKIERRI